MTKRFGLRSAALAVAILAASPVAASPAAPAGAPVPASTRAGAALQSPNQDFGSLEDILLLLGALGAGLVAAVEFWWDNDDRPISP